MDLPKLIEVALSWDAELQLEQEENTRSTILPCQKAEGGTEDKEREVTNSTLNSTVETTLQVSSGTCESQVPPGVRLRTR